MSARAAAAAAATAAATAAADAAAAVAEPVLVRTLRAGGVAEVLRHHRVGCGSLSQLL